MRFLISIIGFTILLGCSDQVNKKGFLFEPGFKTIHTIDYSRIYKPNTDSNNYLHYRPIDIDIWYPAKPSEADTVLLFRNILGLLDKRANYYTASNEGNGISQQIAQLFCTGFGCSDTTKLLNFKTRSLAGAPPADGKFPLIIYLCAFNGMSYENFTLFEELAKEGFVVASVSSIGRYPGDMTMKNEDLMEEVNDGMTVLMNLRQSSNVDSSKIGLIGYSWGGLAAAILINKIPNASCLISLDGSEFHHYGQSKEENQAFEDIKNSKEFKSTKLSVPYLRLESSQSDKKEKEDSVYNFSQKIFADKQIYKVDSAQHEDFICLSWVVRKSGNCQTNNRFKTISKLTISFVQENLTGVNSFAKTIDQELNKTIHKK